MVVFCLFTIIIWLPISNLQLFYLFVYLVGASLLVGLFLWFHYLWTWFARDFNSFLYLRSSATVNFASIFVVLWTLEIICCNSNQWRFYSLITKIPDDVFDSIMKQWPKLQGYNSAFSPCWVHLVINENCGGSCFFILIFSLGNGHMMPIVGNHSSTYCLVIFCSVINGIVKNIVHVHWQEEILLWSI